MISPIGKKKYKFLICILGGERSFVLSLGVVLAGRRNTVPALIIGDTYTLRESPGGGDQEDFFDQQDFVNHVPEKFDLQIDSMD
jgi:hypothetical protein